MNHKEVYDKIIHKAISEGRKRKIDGVRYEGHHIIPKCVDDIKDKNNIVLLTLKEHFICHKLLIFIYPDHSKLVKALWMMSKTRSNNSEIRISAKEYERLRIEHIDAFSGENAPMYGKKHSQETKAKYSVDRLGDKNPMYGIRGEDNPNFGRIKSEEDVKAISERFKGVKKTPEHIAKLKGPKTDEQKKKQSASMKGRKLSEDHKQKLSIAFSGEGNPMFGKKHKTAICEYCGGEFSVPMIAVWHNEKCKHKHDD